MKPFPWRSVIGCALAACVALGLGCSKSEQKAKPPVLTQEQARNLQQRVANIQEQVAELDARLAELRREQALALTSLTSDTQTALIELNLVNQQLGGKAVPAPAPRGHGAAAAEEKGPLSTGMRVLLFIVTIVAILIIIKIFFGRMGAEEDEDDEDLIGDDDPGLEETGAPVPVNMPPPDQTKTADSGKSEGVPHNAGSQPKP